MSQESNKAATLVATRLAPSAAAQLAEIAKAEKRSISAQLAIIIELYLLERDCKTPVKAA